MIQRNVYSKIKSQYFDVRDLSYDNALNPFEMTVGSSNEGIELLALTRHAPQIRMQTDT